MEKLSRVKFIRSFFGVAAAGAIPGLLTASNIPHYAKKNKTVEFQGQKGKRWGMVIDLRKCVGCQGCVTLYGVRVVKNKKTGKVLLY